VVDGGDSASAECLAACLQDLLREDGVRGGDGPGKDDRSHDLAVGPDCLLARLGELPRAAPTAEKASQDGEDVTKPGGEAGLDVAPLPSGIRGQRGESATCARIVPMPFRDVVGEISTQSRLSELLAAETSAASDSLDGKWL
jgi:hypothetical protein